MVVPPLDSPSGTHCSGSLGSMQLPQAASGQSVHRLLAVDHPRGAKFVSHHAKPVRPEDFTDRHLNNAALAKFVKDTLGFHRITDHDAHAEALWLTGKLGWCVASHQ